VAENGHNLSLIIPDNLGYVGYDANGVFHDGLGGTTIYYDHAGNQINPNTSTPDHPIAGAIVTSHTGHSVDLGSGGGSSGDGYDIAAISGDGGAGALG
jgi:hypothetical protein